MTSFSLWVASSKLGARGGGGGGFTLEHQSMCVYINVYTLYKCRFEAVMGAPSSGLYRVFCDPARWLVPISFIAFASQGDVATYAAIFKFSSEGLRVWVHV